MSVAEVIAGGQQQRHDDDVALAGRASASASDGSAFWTKAVRTSTPGARPPDPPGERQHRLLGRRVPAAVRDREQHRAAHAAPSAVPRRCRQPERLPQPDDLADHDDRGRR